MSKFINQPVTALPGDVIVVTAQGFRVQVANVCLQTEDQCKRNQAAYEQQRNPVFGFECPGTVTEDKPTMRFTVPHNDKWLIFYDADQITRIDISVHSEHQQ
jgi:hypothetical protein